MKYLTPIIEAIGPDRVIHVVQSMLKVRAQLDVVHQEALDESVLEFFARNPLALATLMLDAQLADQHTTAVERLLKRAHERAGGVMGRARVEEHALNAGYLSLFPKSKAAEPVFLTRSQRAGLRRMESLARLHFQGNTRQGIELRTWPLLMGPSGVGKSNLARQLAAKLGIPLVKLTYGEWLVSGAKTDYTTLQRIRIAIEKGDKLVLLIDELDKVHATPDPWTRSLLTELYGVLDRQLSGAEESRTGWSGEILRKLRENVFMVGAGTWQDLWREQGRGGFGFGGARSTRDIVDRVRQARIIPPELLNRFNPDWILLEPYTVEDFREIAAHLKLGPKVLDPVAAAESGLNFRAVEAALTADSLQSLEGDGF